jgi:hypothetical protein
MLHIASKFKAELLSVLRLHLSLDVWLLLPVTIYASFELTFVWFEFNRAFATCLLGVNYVGWTNIFQGVLSSMLSLLMGIALKYIGLKAGIVFMLTVSATLNIFILSWTPNPDQMYAVFLLSAGFSLSQSISKGQIIGLYGIYFRDNPAAYSAFALAAPLGLFLGSLVSSYTCVYVKSYIYLFLIFLSIFSFILLEARREKKINEHKELKESFQTVTE